MTRLEKLEHAYKILIEKGNTFMAENVRKELDYERANPTAELKEEGE